MLERGRYVTRVTSVKTDTRGERNAVIVELDVIASGDVDGPEIRVADTMLLAKMDREERCRS